MVGWDDALKQLDLLVDVRHRIVEQYVVEPDQQSQDAWVDHVNEVANATLYPKGGSWYLGANVAGNATVAKPGGRSPASRRL